MAGLDAVLADATGHLAPALAGPGSNIRGPDDIFNEIYVVFLILGTLVGVVVIGYTLYNAYKYRDGNGAKSPVDENPPEVGELPQGGGGGKKLALSFTLSALIVIGLIIWTYTALLYVETGPPDDGDSMEIKVEGFQFGWQYEYPNGETTSTLHAPVNRTVWLNVTSRDVFHNFGIRELGVKTDAIPGLYSETWFRAEEPGQYQAVCYELCGSGHSYMVSDVQIHSQSDYQEWYDSLGANETESGGGNETTDEAGGDGSAAIGATTPSVTEAHP
jgi:cytochrome c oxidase subunit 2